MVPAVIPMLLLMIPAMLTALSVVREKELGSIINLYVTPVTRSEFLLGKQLPYVALAMVNFLLMSADGDHRVRGADQGQLPDARCWRRCLFMPQRHRASACSPRPSPAARSRRCS